MRKMLFPLLGLLLTVYYTWSTFNTYKTAFVTANETVNMRAKTLAVSTTVIIVIIAIALFIVLTRFGRTARLISAVAFSGTSSLINWALLASANNGLNFQDWISSLHGLPTQAIGLLGIMILSYVIPLPKTVRKVAA